jgi:hypothetical protein
MRFKVRQPRNLNAFKRAFFAQHVNERCSLRARICVPIEIYDVIEVARPGALR